MVLVVCLCCGSEHLYVTARGDHSHDTEQVNISKGMNFKGYAYSLQQEGLRGEARPPQSVNDLTEILGVIF